MFSVVEHKNERGRNAVVIVGKVPEQQFVLGEKFSYRAVVTEITVFRWHTKSMGNGGGFFASKR